MTTFATYELPPEVEDLRLRTRAFVRDVVIDHEPAPGARLSTDDRRDLMAQATAAGLLAPHVSRDHGGQGVPLRYWSPILQEAGYSPIGPSVLNCMAPDEGNMHMLEEIATEEQKHDYLTPLAQGRIRSCFAMTEPHPGAGSDPAALQTTATKRGTQWVINGSKRFISGAVGADVAIVMAKTEGGATMFLVDMANPGVRIGAPIHTIDRYIEGGHPHVQFEDCTVEEDAVLGESGQGFRYAQVRLGPARLTHCMRWLGLARRSLDIALDRAATREVFGSRIEELGIAQNLIAESVIDITSADALIHSTGILLENDPKAGSAQSSIAKVACSEAIYRVIDRCVQLTGGDGVSDGLPLAQYLAEVRPFRIYDGTNETHKWAIARRASKERARAVQAGEPFRASLREDLVGAAR